MRRKRAQRARADSAPSFLHARIAADLLERASLVNRRFSRVAILGGGEAIAGGLVGYELIVNADIAAPRGVRPALALDPERSPLADAAFDLVLSVLGLQWVNDLPGALIQIRRALKPDGLFLGAILGGETLNELRAALLEAEAEITGGAALRVSPFADAPALGALLQRAGFALPVTDADRLRVRYNHPLALLKDLRAMGETAAFAGPVTPLRRDVLLRALELYATRAEAGKITATFETITLTGWAPHASQQQPLRPGSAKMRLAEALNVREQSAGEKAGQT